MIGNPKDRFSHDAAQIEKKVKRNMSIRKEVGRNVQKWRKFRYGENRKSKYWDRFSSIPYEKIQVNPRFESGSEILF